MLRWAKTLTGISPIWVSFNRLLEYAPQLTSTALPIYSLFVVTDMAPSMVLSRMVPLTLPRVLLGFRPSITRNLGNLVSCTAVASEPVERFTSFAIEGSGSASRVSVGVGGEHGVDVWFCPDMLIFVVGGVAVCHQDYIHGPLRIGTKFGKKAPAMAQKKGHPATHSCLTPE